MIDDPIRSLERAMLCAPDDLQAAQRYYDARERAGTSREELAAEIIATAGQSIKKMIVTYAVGVEFPERGVIENDEYVSIRGYALDWEALNAEILLTPAGIFRVPLMRTSRFSGVRGIRQIRPQYDVVLGSAPEVLQILPSWDQRREEPLFYVKYCYQALYAMRNNFVPERRIEAE